MEASDANRTKWIPEQDAPHGSASCSAGVDPRTHACCDFRQCRSLPGKEAGRSGMGTHALGVSAGASARRRNGTPTTDHSPDPRASPEFPKWQNGLNLGRLVHSRDRRNCSRESPVQPVRTLARLESLLERGHGLPLRLAGGLFRVRFSSLGLPGTRIYCRQR